MKQDLVHLLQYEYNTGQVIHHKDMSDFNMHIRFLSRREIKIVFDIYNDVPTSSDKTVYIVDLEEESHTLEPSSPSDGAAFYALSLQALYGVMLQTH